MLYEVITHIAQVAVIDDNTRKRLFANVNPMGKVLLLGSLPCRIIGVLAPQDSGFGNTDSLNVWIPYTASMARLEGQRFFSSILIRVKDGMSNAVANQHRITSYNVCYTKLLRHDEHRERHAIDTLLQRQCDALILHSMALPDEELAELVKRDTP